MLLLNRQIRDESVIFAKMGFDMLFLVELAKQEQEYSSLKRYRFQVITFIPCDFRDVTGNQEISFYSHVELP